MKTEFLFGAPCVLDEGVREKCMTFAKEAEAEIPSINKITSIPTVYVAKIYQYLHLQK